LDLEAPKPKSQPGSGEETRAGRGVERSQICEGLFDFPLIFEGSDLGGAVRKGGGGGGARNITLT